MKKFLAFVLDFLISFVFLGYIIALMTGETTGGGFNLQGGSALVLFILIVAYVVIGRKLWGQTLGRKILKVEKK
ncbi:hypothetical protein HN803_01135 [candidate division WWE3 bacterium]|jgi:hypothetical protein|nr:hypothetical protein [candidate division WWE3 bacterium]MBT7349377.1 hypothetical protein [candidate division WWE3 bacterium]